MPKLQQQVNPKPVVQPTLGALLGVCAASLAAGLVLLFFGNETRHQVAAYFFLALLGATVTFGLLGATGMVKTKTWQISGATAVFVVILGILLQFVGEPLKQIKGTLYLDGAVVSDATMILLEVDASDNRCNTGDDGRFQFTLRTPQDEYRFRVVLPDGRETTITASKSRWLKVELTSGQFPAPDTEETPPLAELCPPEPGACNVFLFDYLHQQIEGGELQTFHNIQTDRLDKGIRNHLMARNLLEDINFRVKRCTTPIQNADAAREAARQLNVPAVMWGFLRRSDNKLVSTTTITVAGSDSMHVWAREELGDDVTELIGLDRPVAGAPLAIATLLMGDIYRDKGRMDLAQRAYRHALELSGEIQPRDRPDYLRILNIRLQEVEARNPAAGLTPMGGAGG
jgi:hypothetical protein